MHLTSGIIAVAPLVHANDEGSTAVAPSPSHYRLLSSTKLAQPKKNVLDKTPEKSSKPSNSTSSSAAASTVIERSRPKRRHRRSNSFDSVSTLSRRSYLNIDLRSRAKSIVKSSALANAVGIVGRQLLAWLKCDWEQQSVPEDQDGYGPLAGNPLSCLAVGGGPACIAGLVCVAFAALNASAFAASSGYRRLGVASSACLLLVAPACIVLWSRPSPIVGFAGMSISVALFLKLTNLHLQRQRIARQLVELRVLPPHLIQLLIATSTMRPYWLVMVERQLRLSPPVIAVCLAAGAAMDRILKLMDCCFQSGSDFQQKPSAEDTTISSKLTQTKRLWWNASSLTNLLKSVWPSAAEFNLPSLAWALLAQLVVSAVLRSPQPWPLLTVAIVLPILDAACVRFGNNAFVWLCLVLGLPVLARLGYADYCQYYL
uniref:Transmembrane protein n=1 Tax=Macrostomum lignano TaxID=282301 RepID=A0A1I8GF47_9PLAT